MYQNIATKVLTGQVRLSYVHLSEPYAHQQGAEPKYSCTLLIPKSDTATKADIDSAIAAATQEGINSKWNGVKPPIVKVPIYDGDGVRPTSGEAFGDECKGHWVMTAVSKQKPDVVHVSNINASLAPSDVYSGMYARVTINFYAYANSGNRGIGCGLGNVLKIADGEALSGHASAASDFDGLEQQAAPAQPQNFVPQQAFVPPVQPLYAQQQAAPVIDPITGMPV